MSLALQLACCAAIGCSIAAVFYWFVATYRGGVVMTVAELIAALQKMPLGAEVWLPDVGPYGTFQAMRTEYNDDPNGSISIVSWQGNHVEIE